MAQAADWITHAVAGGAFGFWLPAAWAFVLGFLSHVVLDYAFNEFKPFPLRKHGWWLGVQVAVVAALLVLMPREVAWGILGALTPDLLDGLQSLFLTPGGRFNWPTTSVDEWLRSSCRWRAMLTKIGVKPLPLGMGI